MQLIHHSLGLSSHRPKQLIPDPDVNLYPQSVTNLRLVWKWLGDYKIYEDISMNQFRPLLTGQFQRLAFDLVHNISHPGPNPTLKALQQRFVWHGLRKDVKLWCQQCPHCQKNKIAKHIHAPTRSFEPPAGHFTDVHIDIVGPLKVCKVYRYILTMVDRFTRWPEATLMKTQDTEACAEAFLHTWVARYGVPESLVSDQD